MVLQSHTLFNRINVETIDNLFESENLAKIEKNNPAQWKKRAS